MFWCRELPAGARGKVAAAADDQNVFCREFTSIGWGWIDDG